MRALVYHGVHDMQVDTVRDPIIEQPTDAIVRVTSTAICGSDLHLYDGYIPTTKKGDILGHEFMGEVVETGGDVRSIRKGDRVVVPFTISCGTCEYCRKELWSLCDRSNPNADMLAKTYGYSGAGMFGYSHEQNRIDPSFVITHRLSLSDGPRGYEMFREKKEGCITVVMTP